MKALAFEGIETSIHYDCTNNMLYLDLNTQAKSDLCLYEDGVIRGRYDYENQLDFNNTIDSLIIQLCHEFNNA